MKNYTINCRICGKEAPHDIHLNGDGIPYSTCSNCGVSKIDYSWFDFISQKEALEIIEHRDPRGLFVQKDLERLVGIDNRDGDAWTEEFQTLPDCLAWFLDDEVEELEESEDLSPLPKYETGDGPAEDVALRLYRCCQCNHVWYEDIDAPDYPEYCPGCGTDLCRRSI